jgi:hypothetical protein
MPRIYGYHVIYESECHVIAECILKSSSDFDLNGQSECDLPLG